MQPTWDMSSRSSTTMLRSMPRLKPYQYHGSVYGIIPAKRGYQKPVGEWNSQEVWIRGDSIRITLNGTVILEGDLKEASKDGTARWPGAPRPGAQLGTHRVPGTRFPPLVPEHPDQRALIKALHGTDLFQGQHHNGIDGFSFICRKVRVMPSLVLLLQPWIRHRRTPPISLSTQFPGSPGPPLMIQHVHIDHIALGGGGTPFLRPHRSLPGAVNGVPVGLQPRPMAMRVSTFSGWIFPLGMGPVFRRKLAP
jgi:hypothetical protein